MSAIKTMNQLRTEWADDERYAKAMGLVSAFVLNGDKSTRAMLELHTESPDAFELFAAYSMHGPETFPNGK